MQRLFILSVLVAATTSALADERAIDLQVDPVPFFLDGYAVEAGGSLGGHRAFATVVAYDAAGFLREDERFYSRACQIASRFAARVGALTIVSSGPAKRAFALSEASTDSGRFPAIGRSKIGPDRSG